MEKLAYIRVSTEEQSLDRQRKIIKSFQPDKIFEDTFTGKSSRRPGLDELVKYCRADDIVYVSSIDRLGRSIVDLNNILGAITQKGVIVYFIQENMEFSHTDDPLKTYIFNMLACFAQLEREMIRERQREGIAIAKQAGKYTGRKPDQDKKERIIALHRQGVSRRKIASIHKVASYPTVSKVVAAYEASKSIQSVICEGQQHKVKKDKN